MLKRLSALVLIPLYLITASGFAVSLHYCGKLLTGFEINAPAKPCVKLAKLKCCKDKQITVKVKDAHQAAAFAFKANNNFLQLPPQAYAIAFVFPQSSIISKIHFNKAPPDAAYNSAPLFIQNRTFRI